MKTSEIKALQNIHSTIKTKESIVSEYINQIKMVSKNDYNDILSTFRGLDNIKLPDDLLSYKSIIIDLAKTFKVIETRLKVENDFSNETIKQLDEKNQVIDYLKTHIKKYNSILKQNNIEIPKFEPMKINLMSTVKSDNAMEARLRVLEQAEKNSMSSLNKWLNEYGIDKPKEIPRSVMKESAKEVGINIKMRKDEKNKVYPVK